MVLVEGHGKKSRPEQVTWTGRTDTNKRVVFPDNKVMGSLTAEEALVYRQLSAMASMSGAEMEAVEEEVIPPSVELATVHELLALSRRATETVSKGQYIIVKIVSTKGHTLRGVAIAQSSITNAHNLNLSQL